MYLDRSDISNIREVTIGDVLRRSGPYEALAAPSGHNSLPVWYPKIFELKSKMSQRSYAVSHACL